MTRLLLIALIGIFALLSVASADSTRSGRRLDEIATGRLYDPLLTPKMNPDFAFEPNAEADFLRDIRSGRFDINRLPERQRTYYLLQLDQNP